MSWRGLVVLCGVFLLAPPANAGEVQVCGKKLQVEQGEVDRILLWGGEQLLEGYDLRGFQEVIDVDGPGKVILAYNWCGGTGCGEDFYIISFDEECQPRITSTFASGAVYSHYEKTKEGFDFYFDAATYGPGGIAHYNHSYGDVKFEERGVIASEDDLQDFYKFYVNQCIDASVCNDGREYISQAEHRILMFYNRLFDLEKYNYLCAVSCLQKRSQPYTEFVRRMTGNYPAELRARDAMAAAEAVAEALEEKSGFPR